MRWFAEHLPERGVAVRPISTERPGFALAGPQARASCSRGVADEDVSAAALPFFDIRRMDVGRAPALVARVSFTGELGFEIYVDAADELATLRRAGPGRRGPRPRALRRPRPELAPSGEELRRLAARVHAGLHAAAGRPRPLHRLREGRLHRARRGAAPARRGAAAIAWSPWWSTPPTPMPTATSRCSPAIGWSASSPRAAMATRSARASRLPMSSRPCATADADLAVMILGDARPARLAPEPLFDPSGKRMRS